MFMMATIMTGIIAEKEFEACLGYREKIKPYTVDHIQVPFIWPSPLPQDMLASDNAASILYPSDRGGFKF